MAKKPVETQYIVFLYTKELLTLRQIAERTDMTAAGILKRLRKARVGKQERIKTRCALCDKEITVHRTRFRRHSNLYCDMNCYALSRANPNYRYSRHGMRIARIIVGQHFDLKPEHVVHHKDGNNRNNDLNNLTVFATQSDHLAFHHKRPIKPIWGNI